MSCILMWKDKRVSGFNPALISQPRRQLAAGTKWRKRCSDQRGLDEAWKEPFAATLTC